MDSVDVIVVGAGVVGLAIAAELSKHFNDVLVVDKNKALGEETSSRNSEVVHAGIYYPSESLKAQLSVKGKQLLYQYCQRRNIPFKKLGKLLVGHSDEDERKLMQLQQQALQNGVTDLYWLSQHQIQKSSPLLKANYALCSPSTGIIDSHSYMHSLLAELEGNRGLLALQTEFIHAEQSATGFNVKFSSQDETYFLQSRYLINSAGLHSAKVADNIIGLSKSDIPKISLCRGHYFSYQGASPFKQLIYPIPQAHGLGIHATLDLAGQLKFGPDTEFIDAIEYQVSDKLIDKFLSAIQQYFPTISADRLQPAYSGIRPKLVTQDNQPSFQDFVIQDASVHQMPGLINLHGIESPGLTASLAIAELVGKKIIAAY